MPSSVQIPDSNSYKLDVTFHEDYIIQIAPNGETTRWNEEREIGGGGFGKVSLEKAVVGGAESLRAVKRILRTSAYIQREVKALITVQDRLDLFIEFFGWYEDEHQFFIAMEYASYGDLGNYMKNSREDAYSNATNMTQQLLNALVVLHDRNFYHRDLKPQNVLITSISPIRVKLADFGMSKSTINTILRTQCGTVTYWAPEMQGIGSQKNHFGEKYPFALDMWSLGCMVFEILTSEIPFMKERYLPGEEDSEISGVTEEGSYEPSMDLQFFMAFCEDQADFPLQPLKNAGVSQKGMDFTQRLLVANPKLRMTAKAALEHDWFTQLNPSDVYFEDIKHQMTSLSIDSQIAESVIREYKDKGTPDTIQAILQTAGKDSRSLAFGASEKGYASLLGMLLSIFKGDTAFPDTTIKGWSLLQVAAKGGHLGVVKLLLDCGANINAEAGTTFRGRTALQAAAESKNIKLVKFLLESGADIHAKAAQRGGLTALQAVVSYIGYSDLLMDLVENHKADVNEKPCGFEGRTALQAAAENGDDDAVEFLLQHGAEVNAMPCNQKGRTALQGAAGGGHISTVHLLLKCSANVNAEPCDLWGRTALQSAAESGCLDVVQLLLENSADVNAAPCKKKAGKTALFAAAENGHSDVVRLLLENGADINCDRCSQTALEIATEKGHYSIAGLLSSASGKRKES